MILNELFASTTIENCVVALNDCYHRVVVMLLGFSLKKLPCPMQVLCYVYLE